MRSSRIQLPGNSPTFDILSVCNTRESLKKKTRIRFYSGVVAALASVLLKLPNIVLFKA